MEPEADGAVLGRIFAAEREADRILREAEGRAAALVAEAGTKGREIRAAAAARRAEDRQRGLAAAEEEAAREGEGILAAARERATVLRGRAERRADGLTERLLRRVLPP